MAPRRGLDIEEAFDNIGADICGGKNLRQLLDKTFHGLPLGLGAERTTAKLLGKIPVSGEINDLRFLHQP